MEQDVVNGGKQSLSVGAVTLQAHYVDDVHVCVKLGEPPS